MGDNFGGLAFLPLPNREPDRDGFLPRSPNTHLLKLRRMGVNIQGIRNATLQSLVKEIDATSLARMLGYSKQTLSRHAGAASAPMASYVVGKNPHFAEERAGTTP